MSLFKKNKKKNSRRTPEEQLDQAPAGPVGASSAKASLATRAVQAAVIGAVACGPIALIAATATLSGNSSPRTVANAPRPAATVDAATTGAVQDLAIRTTTTWLRDGNAPGLADSPGSGNGTVEVVQTRPVSVVAHGSDAWAVTIAAKQRVQPPPPPPAEDGTAPPPEPPPAVDRWAYYELSIMRDLDRGTFRAVGHPLAVAAAELDRPLQPLWPTVDDSELLDTAQGFAEAYLIAGDTSRWVTPGTDLPAAPVPGATAAKVLSLNDATAQNVPDARVLVAEVRIEFGDGASRSVTLPFSTTSRDGRWEISSVHSLTELLAETTTPNQQPAPPSSQGTNERTAS